MIGSILLGSAKYSIREYVHVALIIAGAALVNMSGGSKSNKGSSILGLVFLASSLACDGIVGGFQKRLKGAMKERSFEMQFLTNFYMMLTALVFMFVFGELFP